MICKTLIAAAFALASSAAFAQNVHINVHTGNVTAKAYGGNATNTNHIRNTSTSSSKATGGHGGNGYGGQGGNGYYSPTSNYNYGYGGCSFYYCGPVYGGKG